MTQRKQIEALFQRAASLAAEERKRFLDEHCADLRLRAEVERLLEYDARAAAESTHDVGLAAGLSDVHASAPGRGDVARPRAKSPSSSSASEFDHGRFLPGTVVAGRYRIVGLLGQGGMGEVYRADDLELGQSVALKFLPERLASDARSLDRFRHEVRLARQISHPNVCRVYDIGQVDGSWFLTMEYVDGEDLSLLLRRIGRFPKDRAVAVARQLCLGLDAAHEKGVLHRDLKPANVMVDGRGKALITDFGLADFAEKVDPADVRSGTPAYMAPEQLMGREVTRLSDIYSLGLVLHEVFTGKAVWEANTLAELYRKREESTPRTPSSHVEDLDPDVGHVIQSCLEADPRNRPASALSVAAALPGGDPLAAALAAGETPSPEIVAASGGDSRLAPWTAVLLFVVIMAGYVLAAVGRTYDFPALLPVRPEFLARDCEGILRALGYRQDGSSPTGVAYGFREVLGSSPQFEFWYREGPEPLVPTRSFERRVTFDDPPFTVAGMVRIAATPDGALRRFESVTGASAVPPSGPTEPSPGDGDDDDDWTRIFELTRLDPARFEIVEGDGWRPPVFADAMRTWAETGGDGTTAPLRVHAARHAGRLVFLDVDSGLSAEGATSFYERYDAISGILVVFVILVALPLAGYNVARGRSDRRGAFRLGAFFTIASMVAWILGGDHAAGLAEVRMFFTGLSFSIYLGVMTWSFYLALEPYVRRLWPQTLVTWSRLLAWRPRDAAVGRAVLVGGACFSVWVALAVTTYRLNSFLGYPSEPARPESFAALAGGRYLVAALVASTMRAVGDGVFFLIVLLILRALARKGWLAGLIFVLLWTLLWAWGRNPVSWGMAALVVLSIAFVMTRYGILACAAALFFLYVSFAIPMTLDTTAWFWGSTALALSFALAVAGYACWISMGRSDVGASSSRARAA